MRDQAVRFLSLLVAGLALALLAACSKIPDTGPAEVKWDRVTCERCRMVLSDRHNSAEIRVHPEGKRSRVYFFDDIGCAVLWLEEGGKAWAGDPKTEIWVKDYRNGEWIDARSATYVEGRVTPMEYGLGAQAEPVPGGMDFSAAKQRIHEVEERFNVHGVQLLERFREQAAQREATRKKQEAARRDGLPSNIK
jgi:nitrous oxide reductase accessory protein NosL